MQASLQPRSKDARQYVHMQPNMKMRQGSSTASIPDLLEHVRNDLQDLLGHEDDAKTEPDEWPATIITGPIVGSKRENYFRGIFHVIIWLVSLGLVCSVGFGIQGDDGYLEPDDANSTVSNSSYILSPSNTTKNIGWASAVSLILGFAFMIGTASIWDYQYFQEWGWPNVVLQLLTNFAFVGQLYIFIHAAAVPDNDFFDLSLSACVFLGYLVVLLYCISASLDFLMLPRGFIPSLAISFQYINWLVINADEGGAPPGGYTDEQKLVALMLVCLNLLALVTMVLLRLWSRESTTAMQTLNTDFKKQDLGDFPFFRSLVLTMYAAAAALSIYKWSFTSNANPGVWCFSALSVFTQFLIMSVIFYPSSAAAGGISTKDERAYPSALGLKNQLKPRKKQAAPTPEANSQ